MAARLTTRYIAQTTLADKLLQAYATTLGSFGVNIVERSGGWYVEKVPAEGAKHTIPNAGFNLTAAMLLAESMLKERDGSIAP